jgi:hypothetical protein
MSGFSEPVASLQPATDDAVTRERARLAAIEQRRIARRMQALSRQLWLSGGRLRGEPRDRG